MRRQAVLLLFCAGSLLLFSSCRRQQAAAKPDPLMNAYDVQHDWNSPERLIPLDYQEAEGKRIVYEKCVWCHADSTPAGPSNRSNLSPMPPVLNDGKVLNSVSDPSLLNIIALGGSAVGKSAMMPPWGKTLNQGDIRALVVFMRTIASPSYQAPGGTQPQYLVR